MSCVLQMETQALRQQLQEDWEAGEAERQELLRQLHAQAAISAAKVSLSDQDHSSSMDAPSSNKSSRHGPLPRDLV